MLRYDDLQVFVHTSDSGSLSAAARQLDISPAVASAALKRLESELEVRLFARSTRSLRLTPEGDAFLLHARASLRSLEEGRRLLQGGKDQIAGVLQLSAPSDFGRNLLLPWLDEFQAHYPRLSLRLLLGDRVADLYRQPVDVAIRYGAPADSSLVALPLAADNRRVLCAAPAYLAERGEPRQPDDLREHNCLLYQLGGRVHDRWAFQRGRRSLTLTVAGDRVCDDADVVRRWALAGKGLVYKSWLDVAEDVRAGRLRLLLPEWQGEATPLNLLCTHRVQLTRPVTLLRGFVRERCDALLAEAPWMRN
ncbi:LysR family transcriptional regulator [Pseudomonas paraeruginosa]|uniref:LysR family transcriptional regulator n=1 Tax=Pseudomonas aeruginosa group TaxID=136841 RepID=UPI0006B2646C|nr:MULTISPECIES: LysR family transcriptional regulator [Pseudomonas aeruginosa group]KPD31026.1 LysR family transcriptional regulator [Pseudomonas paraeruginosa]KQB29678.1 LysR family transcriptional regulator [Pseudomonas paraeruginosa]KSF75667.1 LysR family transcriptional regulator [Pseudomonas aeruginosa]MDT1026493.1 LysR family transcriptional regulator [Pseudomonas paraeruginosa]PHJ31239.1 LysR family transcriptional regulator [Pseudomonas paraeruginosa]